MMQDFIRQKVRSLTHIRRAKRQASEITRLVDDLAYRLRQGDTNDMTFDWVVTDIKTAIQKLGRNVDEINGQYRPEHRQEV